MSDKRPVRVFDGDLMEAEYARPVYVLTAKPGDTPEDYALPASYAHVGGKLRPKTRIEVTAEDNTWYAVILVLAVEPKISLWLLDKHSFVSEVEQADGEYLAKWAGGTAKWRVLRKSDNTVMVEKLELKTDALDWIEKNGALKQAA